MFPDVSDVVSKVRFFIHQTYAPNNVIDVVHPPYHLIRRGWGEFPARVQIHFKGRSGVNKPVDVMHSIKVRNTNYLNRILIYCRSLCEQKLHIFIQISFIYLCSWTKLTLGYKHLGRRRWLMFGYRTLEVKSHWIKVCYMLIGTSMKTL